MAGVGVGNAVAGTLGNRVGGPVGSGPAVTRTGALVGSVRWVGGTTAWVGGKVWAGVATGAVWPVGVGDTKVDAASPC